MNKRIRELGEQAGITTRKFSFDQYWERPLTKEEEKFAEVIIEECAKIAEDCYTYHEPLSKVPEHIKKFERLTDENMRHKL
jgi:hypothetical protein